MTRKATESQQVVQCAIGQPSSIGQALSALIVLLLMRRSSVTGLRGRVRFAALVGLGIDSERGGRGENLNPGVAVPSGMAGLPQDIPDESDALATCVARAFAGML